MNLEGKTINFLGDSITEGAGVTDCETERYDNIIKKICKLKKVNNYGIGGTRIAHQRVPSEMPRYDLCFCGRAYNLKPGADITVVYGGINDYLHGDAPFGSMSDNTPGTFCGAVEFLMNLLQELYPESKIVFLTPAHSFFKGYIDETKPSVWGTKIDDAKPVAEYAKVIEQKGKEHNIPVLNLLLKLPIDPNIPEHREKYTTDGLHFNYEGNKILADTIIEFLENLK